MTRLTTATATLPPMPGRRTGLPIEPAVATEAAGKWIKGRRYTTKPWKQDAMALEDTGLRLGVDGRLVGEQMRFDLYEDGIERRAAMSAYIGPSGGYLRSPGLVVAFEVALAFSSAVRSCASVVRTLSGEPYRVPTTNDTASEGVEIAENTTHAEVAAVTLGATVLHDRKWYSGLIKVAHELTEDSDQIVSLLGAILGERIGRAQNRAWTSGANGFLNKATLGRTATSATALSYDDIETLVSSVDPAYRANGTFQCHADIGLALRKIVDTAGRPVLMDGQGREPTLLGFPLVYNLHMPSTMASGNKTLAFGDFKRIVVRDVREVRLRMIEERFRDLDQVAFASYLRSDCALVDAGTRPIKYLVH